MKLLTLLLCFLATCGSYCFAQRQNTVLLSSNNGLPTDHIYSVIQDKNGFIWMATDKGVVKYNGYSFKVFTVNDGLPNNDIWKLYEDKKGRIWLYTQAYQQGYIENDRFYALRLPEHQKLIKTKGIFDMGDMIIFHYWENNESYIAVWGEHFTVYINTDQLKKHWNSFYSSFTHPYAYSITYDHLLQRFLGSYSFSKPINSCLMSTSSNSVVLSSSNFLGYKSFFYSFVNRTNKISAIHLNTCSLHSIILGDEKLLVVSPVNNSLIAITDKSVYRISDTTATRILSTRDITDDQVTWQYIDKQNNKWITTENSGLLLQNNFSNWSKYQLNSEQLKKNTFISSVGNKTYWWKDETSMLQLLENGTLQQQINLPEIGYLTSVAKTKDGLLISSNKGLFHLDENGRTIPVFKPSTQFFSNCLTCETNDDDMKLLTDQAQGRSMFVQSYLFPLSDTIFFVRTEGGLREITLRSDTVFIRLVSTHKISSKVDFPTINSIGFFNKKAIVIYNKSTRKQLSLEANLLQKFGIREIINIAGDSSGNVFIQDVDKLICYNIPNRRRRIYQTRFFLNDANMALAGDKLVFTGAFGVSVFNITPNGSLSIAATMVNFKGLDFKNIRSSTVAASGHILLNTDNGFFSIPIADLLLKAANDTRPAFDLVLETPAFKSLHDGDTIAIPNDATRLAVNTINFNSAGELEYSYKNPNSTWQRNSSGDIPLDGIEPGEYYVTQVQVRDKLWKSDIATLYVYQQPLWYQTTTWKIVLWAAGILLFAASLYIVAAMTRKRVVSINETRRKQTELELRAIHSQINPHFIFNTLSTALYFMKTDKTKEAYEHVDKFSKLLRAYLRSSRERWTTLEEDLLILDQYIQLQRARLQHGLSYSIDVDPRLNTKQVMIPSLLLQPLIENAIHHGLFNKGEEGKLSISFKQDDEHELICTIEDNGIGREKAKALKLTQQDPRKSYGTEMTTDLIQTFKKYEQMDIKVKYVDKPEPETGTIVIITFKKIKKAYT